MLDISPSLLFFEIAVFLGLIVILNSVLYKPLLGYMDSRTSSLKQDTAALDQSQDEKEDLIAQANLILVEAKKEAGKIRSDALISSKIVATDMLNITKKSIEQSMLVFAGELDKEKAMLRGSLSANKQLFLESLRKTLMKV